MDVDPGWRGSVTSYIDKIRNLQGSIVQPCAFLSHSTVVLIRTDSLGRRTGRVIARRGVMVGLNGKHRITLFDTLPKELIIEVIAQIFQPWSATVDITCSLQPIFHTQILRTCKFFHKEGVKLIKKSFTGEFIRYDRRGCIVDQNLQPVKWYRWIMKNTTTLHIHDADFTRWYINRYWESYPLLDRFLVTLLQESTYGNPAIEMPDYLDRRKRCDERTQRFVEGHYTSHHQLFQELFTTICDSVYTYNREQWPLVEYQFHDCRCHPERRAVVLIKHVATRPEVDMLIDESFISTAFHNVNGQRQRLHTVLVDCMAIGGRGLEAITFTNTET